MNDLKSSFSAELFRSQGHQIVDLLADKLTQSQSNPSQLVNELTDPEKSYDEICELFARFDSTDSNDERSLKELFEAVYHRSIRLHNPRYLGHQISPVLPVTSLASMMSDFLNNGMGVFEMGVAGTAIERFVVKSLAKKFGFNRSADGVLTSGGTLGNLTALLAARRAKASRDIWKEGTQQQLAVMVSDQAHYCIDKAVRVMGWGEAGVILIPSNEHYQMRCETLEEKLRTATEKGVEVIAVVGSACSTATGSFDDLVAISNFCERNNLWFHVDGAHGAATVYSKKYCKRVTGIERADSITMDFHKLLLTPALATALVFKDGRYGAQNFAQKANYLWNETIQTDEWHDLARRTFECTKSMVGFKVFSILAMHGEEIFDQNVTAVYRLAELLADMVSKQDDFELATQPKSNIVCFRYIPPGESEADELNQINARIRAQLVNHGEFYIVQTKLDGNVWLRTTVANAFTEEKHFSGLLEAIRRFSKSTS